MDDQPTIRTIEAAALWAWPPKRTAGVSGWLLREAEDPSRRTNSAATLAFDRSLPLEAAVRRVEAWYAAAGRPACFQLTDAHLPAGLDDALAARGYARLTPTSVMVAKEPRTGPSVGVELETRLVPAVASVLADPLWDRARRAARADLFARIRRPHVFAVLWQDGSPAAGGLAVLEGRLAGIFAMRTEARHRRRGHARRVLSRLLAWSAAMGADTYYLQVEDANPPAGALYASFGFARAYGYWYRERHDG